MVARAWVLQGDAGVTLGDCAPLRVGELLPDCQETITCLFHHLGRVASSTLLARDVSMEKRR